MRKFLIKVNGNQYEVEVEEIKDGSDVQLTSAASVPVQAPPPSAPAAPKAAAPAALAPFPAPAASPAPAPAPKPAAGTNGPEGVTKVTAPMPGTILRVNVNPGDEVKKNQMLLILEAMKMENEIVAPADGKVVTVNVAKGSTVNAGDTLVTL